MRTIETPEIVDPTTPSPKSNQTEASDPNVIDDTVIDDENQELQLLNSIYESTIREINLGREARTLQSQLDDLNAELRASVEMKTTLLKQLPDTLLKLRDGIVRDPQSDDSENEPSSAIDAPAENTTWKSQSTADFAAGTTGLGQKKLDALADQYPTAGDLNNARIEAAAERIGLEKKLPNGIGRKIADELIERLLQVETSGNQPPASEVVEPRVDSPATDSPATDSPATDSPATDSPATNLPAPPSTANEEHQVDLAHENWAKATAATMRESATDVSNDSQTDPDTWHEGYDAFEMNEPVHAGGQGMNNDHKLDWIRGWLVAEMDEQEAIKEQQETEDDEPVGDEAELIVGDEPESSKASTKTLSLYAIQLRKSGDTKSAIDQELWSEGYQAGIDEQPIEACPSSVDQDHQKEWVRGWVEGSSIGDGL